MHCYCDAACTGTERRSGARRGCACNQGIACGSGKDLSGDCLEKRDSENLNIQFHFDTPKPLFYVFEMKVALTPHQEKFIGKKMEGGGYLSRSEVIREALRVYEMIEHEDAD